MLGEPDFTEQFDAVLDVVLTYEHCPFGEVIRKTGPFAAACPFRFSTKYQDDESDLLYYGFRYYSANVGRWLNYDPNGEPGFMKSRRTWSGGSTKVKDMNLFCFVANQPEDAVDFLGLDIYWPPWIDGGSCHPDEVEACQKYCYTAGLVLKRCTIKTWPVWKQYFYNGVEIYGEWIDYRQPTCGCNDPRSCPPPYTGGGRNDPPPFPPRW